MEYSVTAMLRNERNVNDDNGEQNANNANDNEKICGSCWNFQICDLYFPSLSPSLRPACSCVPFLG